MSSKKDIIKPVKGGTTYTPVAINLAVQLAKRFEAEVADRHDCAWQQLAKI